MAQIPTYDQWMKDTHSLIRPRSEFLKKLDDAVKTQNKEAIKVALDRWKFEQSKQGKDWRKSVRNEKGAATNLYRAVNDLDKRNMTEEDLEALKYISRQQALALQKQFLGVQLRFKPNTLVGVANKAGTKWEQFKSGAGAVKDGGSSGKALYSGISKTVKGAEVLHQGGKTAATAAAKSSMTGNFDTIKHSVTELCHTLCPGLDPNTVFTALHLGGVEQFATNLAPFVGAISSGGKAIVGWIGVAKRCWDGIKIADSRYAIRAGDPEAAFDAILELIERDIKSETGKASVATVAFTGKALGAFADGGAVTGPVIGLLETLAGIFQTVVEYVRDYKECQAGNEMLRVGALNFDLFSVCPLLGCYFLVVQDHLTIINFAIGDFGTPNWMFDAEKLVKKLQPILDKSREYIGLSRLELPNFAHHKGVVEANYSHKTGLDKITGAPAALKDKMADRIEGWILKPEKLPKVDKSRIVGYGSSC
jgi:hypothetical protein